MPSPSIFISSTFYDLRYIRENLMFFVRSLGYNPILSERGTVFFDPTASAANSAVDEVPNCQMFVLIIGGRFGSELPGTEQSVTNAEYKQAIEMHIPVFALVEQGTFSDYEVWRANTSADQIKEIRFPNADDPRIFAFIDEVRSQAVNNALTPFRDFADIESYLRTQWASLLHVFLAGRNEERRVSQTLSGLERISQRVEILSTQILESVGTTEAKLVVEMYDRMLGSKAVQLLTTLGLRPTPVDILREKDFFKCALALGGIWRLGIEDQDDEESINTTHSGNEGQMDPYYAKIVQRDYAELRNSLQEKLDNTGISMENLEARVGTAIKPKALETEAD